MTLDFCSEMARSAGKTPSGVEQLSGSEPGNLKFFGDAGPPGTAQHDQRHPPGEPAPLVHARRTPIMSPSPIPPRSRSRVQAVDVRRVSILVVTIALALATLFVPRQASATTSPRARISPATTASYARTMLGLLNQERRAHGRRPLTMAWRLRESAHRHNLRMARA